MTDAFCLFMQGELWVKNLHISEYKQASHHNSDTKRNRKLLLNKKELIKIGALLKEKGTTLIPITLFFNERGIAKLEISIARVKKKFDKREDLKKRDQEREIRKVVR